MSQNSNSDKKELKVISFLTILGIGLAVSSLGPLLVPIADFFHLEIARAAFPVVFNSIGFLLATILFSFIWYIYRARLFLATSSLLLIVSLSGIVFLHNILVVVLILFLFLGLGRGILSSSIYSLFSEISGSERVKYLNFLFLFFGVGAFTGPLLVGALLTYKLQWYTMYLLLALIILPLSITFWRKKLYRNASFSKKQKVRDAHLRGGIANSSLFWSLILARFLLMGGQISFFSFIPLFLARVRNFSPDLASYIISIFWLTMIAGRGVYARYLHRSGLSRSLIAGASSATLFTTLSFLFTNEALIVTSVACSGLFLSFVSPGLLALGGNVFPEYIGFTTGTMLACAGIGGIFFPWLIGIFSQKVGFSSGVFLIPALIAGAASILIHFHYFLTERGQVDAGN